MYIVGFVLLYLLLDFCFVSLDFFFELFVRDFEDGFIEGFLYLFLLLFW